MNRTKVIAVICSAVFAALLGGCGGGNAGNASIGGTVSGLAPNTSVSLTNNGGTPITIPGNQGFTFGGTVSSGNGYNVAVSTQPTGQTCLVTYGSGVINYSGTDVTNVTVKCTANVPIGVSVSGLAAGNMVTFNLILQNSPTEVSTLPLTGVANTTVTGNFATTLPLGTVYSVSVATQPGGNPAPTQVCSIAPNSPASASGGVVGTAPIVVGFACM